LNEGQRAIIAARAKVMFEEEAAERERAHQFKRRSDGSENESVIDAPSPQPSPVGRGSDAPSPQPSPDGRGSKSTATANLQEPGRTANAQAAELLNISERSVATASRVLQRGDEQVIAAVESGALAVSDARAIVDRPKDQQRQALAAVRQGRARTLRRAAEQAFGVATPPCGAGVWPALESAGGTPTPQSRRQLRREATRFVRQLDKLLLRLDALTAAFGANEHTDRMRQCLHHLVDLFRDFAQHCLPSK
ncbi:MAG TPA: hypothetical protein VFI31_30020, partial [Pirellulales bacterium]|nr:hypothetical protein [Pirellulales bacterium]